MGVEVRARAGPGRGCGVLECQSSLVSLCVHYGSAYRCLLSLVGSSCFHVLMALDAVGSQILPVSASLCAVCLEYTSSVTGPRPFLAPGREDSDFFTMRGMAQPLELIESSLLVRFLNSRLVDPTHLISKRWLQKM